MRGGAAVFTNSVFLTYSSEVTRRVCVAHPPEPSHVEHHDMFLLLYLLVGTDRWAPLNHVTTRGPPQMMNQQNMMVGNMCVP